MFDKRERDKKYTSLVIISLLGLIIAWGFSLRFFSLGEQSLWIDEGFTINGSLSVIEKGLPILDSGAFYRNGLFSTYIVAGLINKFGLDPFSPWVLRLPAVFFGTLTILISWLLYKSIFKDKLGAILAAFIVSFSYWEIAWSRQVRGYAAASFFILLSTYFLWKYVNDFKRRNLIYTSVFFFLAYLSQESILALLPVIISSVFLAHYRKDRQTLNFSYFYLGGYTLSVMGVVFFLASVIPPFSDAHRMIYFDQFSGDLKLFFCFTIIAAVLVFFDKRTTYAISFVVSIVLITTPAIVFFSPASQLRYFFPLFVFMIFSAVYSTRLLGDLVSDKRYSFLVKVFCPALLFFFVYPYLNFAPKTHYWLERGSPQPDFKGAFEIIKKRSNEDDVVISGYTQMHKVFLNKSGMWLKMYLNGRPDNMQSKVVNGRDYYTAAPVIFDLADFQKVIQQKHGFIIIDSMTKNRLPEINEFVVTSHQIKKIYESELDGLNKIWLYSF